MTATSRANARTANLDPLPTHGVLVWISCRAWESVEQLARDGCNHGGTVSGRGHHGAALHTNDVLVGIVVLPTGSKTRLEGLSVTMRVRNSAK